MRDLVPVFANPALAGWLITLVVFWIRVIIAIQPLRPPRQEVLLNWLFGGLISAIAMAFVVFTAAVSWWLTLALVLVMIAVITVFMPVRDMMRRVFSGRPRVFWISLIVAVLPAFVWISVLVHG
jgi:hypothetical protein